MTLFTQAEKAILQRVSRARKNGVQAGLHLAADFLTKQAIDLDNQAFSLASSPNQEPWDQDKANRTFEQAKLLKSLSSQVRELRFQDVKESQ